MRSFCFRIDVNMKVKQLLAGASLHLITNVLLAVVYFVLKVTYPICEYMFDDCILELKEWEWVTFLGCIIVIKNRKQVTYLEYLGTACLFAKVLNGFMFFTANPVYGIVYAVACLLHVVYLPKPVYEGPEFITYFTDTTLTEELERDKRITWFITFYAAWSPSSINFAPPFAELSSEYHLDNLKFGKVDISKYPDVAKKYNIDHSSWSKQLPTLIVFHEGKEEHRKPFISPKGTVVKYKFTKESVIRDFDINNWYDKCKKNPLKTRRDAAKEKKEN